MKRFCPSSTPPPTPPTPFTPARQRVSFGASSHNGGASAFGAVQMAAPQPSSVNEAPPQPEWMK